MLLWEAFIYGIVSILSWRRAITGASSGGSGCGGAVPGGHRWAPACRGLLPIPVLHTHLVWLTQPSLFGLCHHCVLPWIWFVMPAPSLSQDDQASQPWCWGELNESGITCSRVLGSGRIHLGSALLCQVAAAPVLSTVHQSNTALSWGSDQLKCFCTYQVWPHMMKSLRCDHMLFVHSLSCLRSASYLRPVDSTCMHIPLAHYLVSSRCC